MEVSFYLSQLSYSKTLYDNCDKSKGIEKGYKRKTRKARTGAGFRGDKSDTEAEGHALLFGVA
ncbi:hypothetical protein [Pectobacterium brasiliense]|uniref:hypothetical protein n=1 Tax=Pectobacterium brasiliense TaxID=180957 RepID=UPI0013DFD36D|nr:hypothetical protein [Pectobacterium brasiliense]GKX41619.1 hypothetical protein SOASR015_06530 [Pectobacterium carotovorum subsp. carotovorum]GLX54978.1 hypothetical protein Pcaca02_02870 [Pectobacterium carotovorum subsp. carotovorum]